jgi:8-oxo-dGTP pyrophosphatase MutT (NUDIX family)
MPPRLRSNLVSVYLVRPTDAGLELLLLQRQDDYVFPGDWQSVHGHLEGDEPAWRGAMREAAEETNLPIERWWRLEQVESFYNPDNDTVYFIPAFLGLVAAGAEPVLSAEHQAHCWLPPPAARERLRWQTQRRSVDTIAESLADWPTTGPGIILVDVAALERRDGRQAAGG